MNINKNLEGVGGSLIRQQAALVSQTPGVLNFTIGEPDMDTSDVIKDAMKQALDDNETHYAPTPGLNELHQEIANYYDRRQNMQLNPEQMIVTVGATEALTATLGGIMNPGEKVIVPTPAFPQFMMIIKMLGGEPVLVDTSDTDFKITPEVLAQTLENNPETKAFLLNYPSNPLGASYSKAEISALADVLKQYDIMVISDEIYAELNFTDEDHYSIYNELPDQLVMIGGLSKSHAMTGFRIGFIHVPEKYYTPINVFHQGMVTTVSTPNQYAAIAAYRDGDAIVDENIEAFKRRNDLLRKRFGEIGLDLVEPKGAFYLFPAIPESYNGDDVKFTNDLFDAGIGVVPGSAFGPGGEGHIRLSYASKYEDLVEGMNRLEKFIKNL